MPRYNGEKIDPSESSQWREENHETRLSTRRAAVNEGRKVDKRRKGCGARKKFITSADSLNEPAINPP